MTSKNYICLDVGGTWVKGAVITGNAQSQQQDIYQQLQSAPIHKLKSNLAPDTTVAAFVATLKQMIDILVADPATIGAIAISTAGVVDFAGKKLDIASPHLAVLKQSAWLDELKAAYGVAVTLVNDSDAVTIGAAAKGYLSGYKIIGIMPIGTGLGFTLWRNARKWTPHFSYTLLGAIETPAGYYDEIASASRLAQKDAEGDLARIFTHADNKEVLEQYLDNLAQIIRTSNTLYHTQVILLGGGLANAAMEANYPLAAALEQRLRENAPLYEECVEIKLLKEGNVLALFGVALLALAESEAQRCRKKREYKEFTTESPYKADLQLHTSPAAEVIKTLWMAEQEAGELLEPSIAAMAKVSTIIAQKLKEGGRLIYVGCGTSGRLAAIDTVEIACTFGFPRESVLTLVAGGVADAAIDIEMRFEEDASAVPELLMANLTAKDVVVGVSVSGSAYYVQSALAYAQSIGAESVMIQEQDLDSLPFCQHIIALRSGFEVIAGSTRMKAGTATKKVINFLSTSAMIALGKVTGCYMTEVECLNEKLIARAQNILKLLYQLDSEEATKLLEAHDFQLNKAIATLESKK